jgi:hypothetical protein
MIVAIRRRNCGTFFLVSDCTTTGLDARENPDFPQYVHETELAIVIQAANSESVELLGFDSCWT